MIAVSNRLLDRITVYQSREISVTENDRLLLKANRKLSAGGRVINGELVTVKSVCPGGGIELSDGRVLDNSFREFQPGYAVTSYGSQGKTVDFVPFSDSTIKMATNAHQWYPSVIISSTFNQRMEKHKMKIVSLQIPQSCKNCAAAARCCLWAFLLFIIVSIATHFNWLPLVVGL
jgi:hypothetical protein